MKILAVDDDPFVLELVQLFLLEVCPCEVTAIASPVEALEAVRTAQTPFDCMLLDISMPEIDGIELCRRIRALPGHARTPIIMLTAMTERSYVDRAFRAGATDYLTKPIEMTELQARLRSAGEIIAVLRENAAQAQPKEPAPIALDREVPLIGVGGLLDYAALVNYLLQLSRGNLDAMQVVAVALKRPESVHSRATPAEFTQILTDIAASVSTVFASLDSVLAYCGGGNFVVMFRKETLEPSTGLESAVQLHLDTRVPRGANAALPDIEVAVGNPIRPNPGKTHRVRKTLDRAIERARTRADR
ncbi:MAG: response regulator [Rhodobacteraceae bacterium]|nr:response regulator [Paracoccaceae bacterium]